MSIKGLFEAIDMGRQLRINKTWRLGHEEGFVENDIQKNILDIELVERPFALDRKSQNHMNSSSLNNRTKRVTKVCPLNLSETLSDKSSFMSFN